MNDVNALPELDIDAPEFLRDPPAALRAALAVAPVWRSARGIEVLDYRTCLAASRDRRLWVNNLRDVEALGLPEGPVMDFKRRMILGQGLTEDRAAIRQTLSRLLGAQMANGMRSVIRQIARSLLDDMVAADPSGPADFLNAFCVLLPARLYCHWVGAPDTDAPFSARMSEAVMRIFLQRASDIPAILSAYSELFPYIRRQVRTARQDPRDNVLGSLLAEVDRGNLTEVQVDDFAVMLLEASIENSAHQLALVVGSILGDAAVWAALVETPGLIAPAVQEGIRLHSRVGRLKRYTREAIDLDGLAIPAEAPVILDSWSAHLDPTVFPDPGRFLLDRADPARNLTFGGGNFNCLGQFVAVVEIEETLGMLAELFPGATVAHFATAFSSVRESCVDLQVRLMPCG